MSPQEQKRRAAARSLDFVAPGMVLGLGTGSTAAIMVELLGERVRAGLAVTGIPTSDATAALAQRCGVTLTSLEQVEELDLTIDGADETDGELRLIKGGGGALLREKIVASLSKRVVIIADAGKKVARLGAFPLPVEVVPFAAPAILPRLAAFGCDAKLRSTGDGGPFVSDEGNHIIDCSFGAIEDPESLARQLNAIPGVVEHGLFLGIAERVLLGGADGVEELVRHGA